MAGRTGIMLVEWMSEGVDSGKPTGSTMFTHPV